MSDLSWFLSKSDLLPSDNLQKLPTNFSMTLIKAFEIRSNVCNNLCWLILLDKVEGRQNVKNFRDKVLDIDFFLIHHKGFDHFFDWDFVGGLLLVDELVENVGKKLPSKKLTFNGSVFSFDKKVFVLYLWLRLLSAFIFKELSNHASESDKNCMILRDSHDKAETLEKEYHFEGFFIFLEDASGLMNEVTHVKNFFVMIIKEFHELLDKSTYFLSCVDNVRLIH